MLRRVATRWHERAGVPVGPGDDMAVIEVGGARLLVAADPVIEGVHFEPGTHERRVAAKAVHRNCSDAAAMGAIPRATIMCVMLGQGCDQDAAERLLDALCDTADAAGCPSVGGDISVHDGPTTVAVTLIADPAGAEPVLRSRARAGDDLYVTGVLGGSMVDENGYIHHLDFSPRVAVGRALVEDASLRPNAMIDLSDGLARDLPRVLEASGGLGAEIELNRLPVREVVAGQDGWRRAIGDGEDYELLMSCSSAMPATIRGVRLTRIGRVVADGGLRYLTGDGRCFTEAELSGLGWEHGR
ncbi:Thiamine-monophosphate kinase [Mucisphaera calidilacus]|uniref:Thiamine-monophosphate kinase n=1 Tax=Mucisphaera calidilacus TaxID=2527982 RepID=A0A518BVH5_9BACT|nr:Thiamine-monophosphate kinase [Mucisphaera calidilacus]